MKRLVFERAFLKMLVDRNGMLFAVTTKSRAYFFFVSARYVGLRLGPTTDPYPGIVEVCGYDLERILREWGRLYKYSYRVDKRELKRRLGG